MCACVQLHSEYSIIYSCVWPCLHRPLLAGRKQQTHEPCSKEGKESVGADSAKSSWIQDLNKNLKWQLLISLHSCICCVCLHCLFCKPRCELYFLLATPHLVLLPFCLRFIGHSVIKFIYHVWLMSHPLTWRRQSL